MAHYYVFHELGKWCRTIDAKSSYEARKLVSGVTATPDITCFFAVRADLMKPADWKRLDACPNK